MLLIQVPLEGGRTVRVAEAHIELVATRDDGAVVLGLSSGERLVCDPAQVPTADALCAGLDAAARAWAARQAPAAAPRIVVPR